MYDTVQIFLIKGKQEKLVIARRLHGNDPIVVAAVINTAKPPPTTAPAVHRPSCLFAVKHFWPIR